MPTNLQNRFYQPPQTDPPAEWDRIKLSCRLSLLTFYYQADLWSRGRQFSFYSGISKAARTGTIFSRASISFWDVEASIS